jgi:hypothetical protein
MAQWRAIAGATLLLVLALLAASLLVFRSPSPDSATPPPVGNPTVTVPPDDPPLPSPSPVVVPPPGRGSFGRGGRATIPPAPPRPAPGPETITDRFDEVDAALGDLVVGRVAFNTPDRMQFGESRTIALIASPELDATTLSTELRDRIGGADPIAIEELQIAPLMEAQLEGAPAFEIAALTPTRQPVSRASPTEWRWTVRAAQTGTHTLHLTINAIIIVAGERYPRSLDVLNRDIEVDITAAQRVAMFVENNWQWLLGTVVFPLGIWLWSHGRKQTRKHRK